MDAPKQEKQPGKPPASGKSHLDFDKKHLDFAKNHLDFGSSHRAAGLMPSRDGGRGNGQIPPVSMGTAGHDTPCRWDALKCER